MIINRSNGSVPTLERVRREESNHSIGSHSQTSSGQVRRPGLSSKLKTFIVIHFHSFYESQKNGFTESLESPRSESESFISIKS